MLKPTASKRCQTDMELRQAASTSSDVGASRLSFAPRLFSYGGEAASCRRSMKRSPGRLY